MERWRYLSRLGFNEYQARVLSCLIREDSLSAEEISKETEVPYSKIYSVLNNLEDIGLIFSNSERPKRYRIDQKDKVIDHAVEKKRKEFIRMKRKARETKKEIFTMDVREGDSLKDH